jgi:archaemetzincin
LQPHQLAIDTTNYYGYLREFSIPLLAPEQGEWRYYHHEAEQSYAQYLLEEPIIITAQRNKIYVLPIGDFSADEQKLFTSTTEYLKAYFGVPVLVQQPLPLSVLPSTASRQRSTWTQYLTTYILNEVLAKSLPTDAATYICLTNADLYPEASWNFVFGQADLHKRVGVWSLFRLKEYDANQQLIWQKSLKRVIDVAAHELGHSFSMRHCVQYECVMNGSNSLEEGDRQPCLPCVECIAKLEHATKITNLQRLQALYRFFEKEKFVKEAEQCAAMLTQIRKYEWLRAYGRAELLRAFN